MKPTFALNLSHDGIGLLRREAGGWTSLGEAALEDANLTGALDTLRRRAEAAAPQGVRSKLVIPASQILFTEIEAPGPGTAQRRRQIATALEGMTPYAVADLVFDWSGHGEVVQVAVVARETLEEAESFADTYGFNPVSFVAIPAPGQFAGEPWFGPTRIAAQLLPEGARIERDQDPVRILVAAAPVVAAEVAATVAAVAEAAVAPEVQTEADPEPAPETPEAAIEGPVEKLPGTPEPAADDAARQDIASAEPTAEAPQMETQTAEPPVAPDRFEETPAENGAALENAPEENAPEESMTEPSVAEVLASEEAPSEDAPIAGTVPDPTPEPAEPLAAEPVVPEPQTTEALTTEALTTEALATEALAAVLEPADLSEPAPEAPAEADETAPVPAPAQGDLFSGPAATEITGLDAFAPDAPASEESAEPNTAPEPVAALSDSLSEEIAPDIPAGPEAGPETETEAVSEAEPVSGPEPAPVAGPAEAVTAETAAVADTSDEIVEELAPAAAGPVRDASETIGRALERLKGGAPAIAQMDEAETAGEAEEAPAPELAEPAIAAFTSRRSGTVVPQSEAGAAPRLGGVGRLTPVASDTESRLARAGVTQPGLALPPDTASKVAEAKALAAGIGSAARAGLGRAAKGTARRAGQAGLALAAGIKAQTARAKAARAEKPASKSAPQSGLAARAIPTSAPAKPSPETPQPAPETALDRTVFGAKRGKRIEIGGKPKHLGLMLGGGLVGFLAIAALWSSFLGEAPQTAAPQAPAADTAAGQAPLAEATETTAPVESAAATDPGVDVVAPDTATQPGPETASVASATATEADPATDLTASASSMGLTPGATAPGTELRTAAQVPEGAETAPATGTEPAPQSGTGARAERTPALTLAGPDPALAGTDAAAMPSVEPQTDTRPATPTPPPPFDQLARIDPEGRLEPTPQGVVTPGGFTLYAGRPDTVPAARPEAVSRAAAAALAPAPATAPAAEPTPAAETPAVEPAVETPAAPPAPYADPALRGFRPAPRPAAVLEKAATAQPAPATEPAPAAVTPAAVTPDDGAALDVPAETAAVPEVELAALDPALARLATKRPKLRPAAILSTATAAAEAAARAEAEAQAAAAAAAQAEAQRFASATAQAVEVSRRPAVKPRNFSASVERALAAAIAAEPAPTPVAAAAPAPVPAAAPKAAPAPPKTAPVAAVELDEPEPTTPAPKLPTSASVAKQATVKNGIQLGEMNLIGLYGSSKSRRALIRMPNGKFVKVAVGDRLDGGKVTAIGDGQLTYQKGSRSYTLKLLKGS